MQSAVRSICSVCFFCDGDGNVNRIQHPALKEHEAEEGSSGGFFHIRVAEIHPDHSKNDLGIRMVRELMMMLKDPPLLDTSRQQLRPVHSLARWTLAVIFPGPLGNQSSFPKDPKKYWYPDHDTGDHEEAIRKVALDWASPRKTPGGTGWWPDF
jgi:hypothetical protein